MNTSKYAPGTYDRDAETTRLQADWADNPRWQHVTRSYSADDAVRLRGSLKRDNMLARRGAEKLWDLIQNDAAAPFVNAIGAPSGGHAAQQVRTGMQAIYVSSAQVAADTDTSTALYPDQSAYAADSIPAAVRRLNNAFERADQIQWKAGKHPGNTDYVDYFAPIVATAEAGCAGALNAYELMTNMIRAGAAGVFFDDQLAGHSDDGNVLIPTQEAVQKLIAARLATDVEDAPTLILARTGANAANLLTSDCDDYDQPFVLGERNEEGFYPVSAGIEQAIARGLAYAPYADLLCLDNAALDLDAARQFAAAIRRNHPQQMLAYSCTAASRPDQATIAKFQRELAALGYQFQFIALASGCAQAQPQCSGLAA